MNTKTRIIRVDAVDGVVILDNGGWRMLTWDIAWQISRVNKILKFQQNMFSCEISRLIYSANRIQTFCCFLLSLIDLNFSCAGVGISMEVLLVVRSNVCR